MESGITHKMNQTWDNIVKRTLAAESMVSTYLHGTCSNFSLTQTQKVC